MFLNTTVFLPTASLAKMGLHTEMAHGSCVMGSWAGNTHLPGELVPICWWRHFPPSPISLLLVHSWTCHQRTQQGFALTKGSFWTTQVAAIGQGQLRPVWRNVEECDLQWTGIPQSISMSSCSPMRKRVDHCSCHSLNQGESLRHLSEFLATRE